MQMGNKRQGKVLLISGDKGTPASIERTQGALNGFRQAGIEPLQLVYGHWQEQRARAQTQVLLNRYPGLEGIWTANDHMAFGAIAALEDKGSDLERIFSSPVSTLPPRYLIGVVRAHQCLGRRSFAGGGRGAHAHP